MNTKKATYLSLFLLTSFLVSVTLNLVFTYQLGTARSHSLKQQTVSPSDNEGQNINNGFNNLVKTESETENDLEDAFTVQAFIIPTLYAFFTATEDAPQWTSVPSGSIGFAEPNPIYIAVRNFRI
jgi:hypothetical protein